MKKERAHLARGSSWVQTKDYKIGISCFSASHAVLQSKN
jgi:hypothetical protein